MPCMVMEEKVDGFTRMKRVNGITPMEKHHTEHSKEPLTA